MGTCSVEMTGSSRPRFSSISPAPAEPLLPQSGYLRFDVFDSTVVADHDGRHLLLLFEWELSPDPLASGLFGHPSISDESADLFVFGCRNHDQDVEPRVRAGLDDERRVEDHDGVGVPV